MGGRWIPVAWSVIFAFLLMATFYLRKTEKETKTLKCNFHTIALSKGSIFPKKNAIFAIKANITKIKEFLVLKGIYSQTNYASVHA